MKKHHLLAGALAALAIAPVGAQTAAAQTWNVTNALSGPSSGTPSSYTVDPNWSIVTRSGPDCNQGAATPLTVDFNNGYPQFRGRSSNNNDYRPNVLKKFTNNTGISNQNNPIAPETIKQPYAGGQQIKVSTNRIVMDPAVNECAILRFTVPSSGNYWANANFLGAFVNQNSPNLNFSGGFITTANSTSSDGVDGMILINGAPYGSKVVAATITNGQPKWVLTGSPIIRALNVGDTIDFAVWSRGGYNYDLTILQGWVQKK